MIIQKYAYIWKVYMHNLSNSKLRKICCIYSRMIKHHLYQNSKNILIRCIYTRMIKHYHHHNSKNMLNISSSTTYTISLRYGMPTQILSQNLLDYKEHSSWPHGPPIFFKPEHFPESNLMLLTTVKSLLSVHISVIQLN